ncbi:acyl-CoA synthetase (AMP-forming)/AMP-acid ligase II [Krasilnikovia cinnamomea]|uniref:Acyl-CoA synthetase (AMP-forming)/AMP-acid ligase II n=1 Tax=Krasilnikovia cinnamomea TaxID=349313 RepID=A0A4Q7ZM99_9ACTN|nr:AMP-binding protein [Krasilnikovia cinnamomea]RZU51751.1 acyl-CoA synthetase (AMP-forming)/AMP-acid ligase II [Krasilnikovia cinnamomea]
MNLLHPDARVLDAATGATLDHAQVDAAAADFARHAPGVAFALTPTELPAVARYLGALRAGRPVALLDPELTAPVLHDLIARFAPALVTGVTGAPPDGYRAEPAAHRAGADTWVRQAPAAPVHPDLALLLTTSGSTGNPKLVRLSAAAVRANAEAIAASLGITGAETAPTTLPLFYTYGLSVLHSHLLRGATVVLERSGMLHRDFWAAVDTHRVTSLAAVPYQYEMLRRLRFDPARYPHLRTLTQAGGRLRTELVADFGDRMAAAGGWLFVMYGQTEATARMTVLPPDRLADKLGSAGLPIPGGALATRDGEVVYTGPNVMMGYAETARDLARGDDLGGVLRTGDLGHLDDDGFLFLTGRLKRIGKVFGVRVNLDDVERGLATHGAVAAVAGDDRIHVFVEGADAEHARAVRGELAGWLDTHFSGLDVRGVDALPLLPTGKIDYRRLEASL